MTVGRMRGAMKEEDDDVVEEAAAAVGMVRRTERWRRRRCDDIIVGWKNRWCKRLEDRSNRLVGLVVAVVRLTI